MSLIEKIAIVLTLTSSYALIEASSINVTLSSQNVENGSSINITAKFDPTIGSNFLRDMLCVYTHPGGGITRLTTYDSFYSKKIVIIPSLPASELARLSIVSSVNQTVLTISPITFEDEKRQFYCAVEYYPGLPFSAIRSEQYMLENVYSKAVLNEANSIQSSTFIAEGATFNLTCIATGRPAPNMTWQYNSKISATVFTTSVGSPLITVTSVLAIQNSSQALRNETVTCLVRHPFTSTMNRKTSIHIYYAPAQVLFRASSSMPINGLSVILTCTASSVVSTSFKFLLANGSSSVIVQDGSSTSYATMPLNYKDYNNYKATFQCISYNRAGESPPQTLVLDIQVRPEISIQPKISEIEGRDVILDCKVIAANPVANITWRSPTGTDLLSANGTVFFPSVNRRHHGEYTCLASNGIGSVASKATYLSVNYGPEFIQDSAERLKCMGETVSLNCNAVGHPAPDVFLYLNGTLLKRALSNLSHHFILDTEGNFGAYTCVSSNMFGTVNVTSTLKMKPSGGVNNAIMHVKDNTIRVTWQLPQCSGNIREIKVQYRKKGQSKWQWELIVATIADTEITINGLENGVEYEVRVVVVDTNGVTHETIGKSAAKAGIQSNDNGALIGGIVGGVFFLAIIFFGSILVVKKRRQSSEEEENTGNATLGIDADMTNSVTVELGKFDDIHCMVTDASVNEAMIDNCDRCHDIFNKNFAGDSVGVSAPLSKNKKSA